MKIALKDIRNTLIALCCLTLQSHAQQQKVWVFFRDKAHVEFDPCAYFHHKAIERRHREGLSLYDSTDFPLNESYKHLVSLHCDSISGESRWLNALACYIQPQHLADVCALPFVKEVQPIGQYQLAVSNFDITGKLSGEMSNILATQVESMQNSLLKKNGLNGAGVRIAVFDGGFKGFSDDAVFKKLIDNDHIKATYDFVKRTKFVFAFHPHGSHVMSCLAGIFEGKEMGCATAADYLLARTEQVMSESQVEEEHWLHSLEWADKHGADIINSSLGYTNTYYFRHEMDGKSSIITQAANMAAGKGILVVNSAGNEGNTFWEIVAAPADADSVLTIGGLNPKTLLHSEFSSYGPTADLRRKPNLSALGEAIGSSSDKAEIAIGTSFSSPLVAGFAACIRQLHPEWTLHKLFGELERSGHLYPYFDYAHGYGIPQASYFLDSLQVKPPTFQITYDQDEKHWLIQVLKLEIPNILSDDTLNREENHALSFQRDYVYLHGEGEDGVLDFYEVQKPNMDGQVIIARDLLKHHKVRIHCKGFTMEMSKQQLIQSMNEK